MKKYLTLLLLLGVFTATKAQDAPAVPAEEPKSLTIEGYVDAYVGVTSDSLPTGSIQQFTTIAPRPNSFGLNTARLKATYRSDRVRGNLALFFGDVSKYNWDAEFPYIQEANAGVRFAKKFWFDIGFFSTHIGTEMLLPKDNICSSISLVTQHEPFFMSAASISYESEKITAKLIAVNSYYRFYNPNDSRHKGGGLLFNYKPTDKISLTYANLISNETNPAFNLDPTDGADTTSIRFYNNLYMGYSGERLSLTVGTDIAVQTSSALVADANGSVSLKDGFYIGALANVKYSLGKNKNLSPYGRVEFFWDDRGVLSAQYAKIDANGVLSVSGLKALGITAGFEYKPVSNAYLRLEGRFINALDDQKWFNKSNDVENTNIRIEGIFTAGLWFESNNLLGK